MKCNRGTELVCYYYDKCLLAFKCPNVPQGIRKKLKEAQKEKLKKG